MLGRASPRPISTPAGSTTTAHRLLLTAIPTPSGSRCAIPHCAPSTTRASRVPIAIRMARSRNTRSRSISPANRLLGRRPMVLRPVVQVTVEIATSTIGSVTVTEADGALGGVDTVVITSSELEINLQTVDSRCGHLWRLHREETVYPDHERPPATARSCSRAPRWATTTPSRRQTSITGTCSSLHDGSENHQDEFEFNVTGGTAADFDGTFTLDAIPTNDAPSVGASDLPLIAGRRDHPGHQFVYQPG